MAEVAKLLPLLCSFDEWGQFLPCESLHSAPHPATVPFISGASLSTLQRPWELCAGSAMPSNGFWLRAPVGKSSCLSLMLAHNYSCQWTVKPEGSAVGTGGGSFIRDSPASHGNWVAVPIPCGARPWEDAVICQEYNILSITCICR